MLKLSEATTLALHGMILMSLEHGEYLQTKEIANGLSCSIDHLSKVLQRLRKSGLVMSTRGPKGGSKLAKDPSEITLLEIIEVIEGKFKMATCMLDNPICGGNCFLFGGLIEEFDSKLKKHLSTTTLADAEKLMISY
ncbi:MAG: Rrf2 family transcriptional regulator [Kiritimatiellae bacterium]|nr:Rrf2 family transcriptional regulator [Kiritimatiellia bacterium]